MNNAEWCIKQGYKFRELTCKCSKTGNCDYDILLNNKCIGKVKDSYPNKAITTWLDMEHNEPILDDAERKYLSEVIRPFRDDVQFIMKYKGCFSSRVYEEIAVWYRDKIDGEKNYCMLPKFEKGTMYKNMEVSRHYTLEELGL